MKKIIDPITKKELKWHTFEETFSKVLKNKKSRRAYEEEVARRRLAQKVRDTRKARRLTQAAVARKADMPQSVIARLESGTHGVSFDTLSKVAHALGKQVELV